MTNLYAIAPLNSIASFDVHKIIVTDIVKNTSLKISTIIYGT